MSALECSGLLGQSGSYRRYKLDRLFGVVQSGFCGSRSDAKLEGDTPV